MIHVLHRNFTSLLSMVRPSLIVNLRKLHPFVSVVSLRVADLSGSIPSLVVIKPVLRTRPEFSHRVTDERHTNPVHPRHQVLQDGAYASCFHLCRHVSREPLSSTFVAANRRSSPVPGALRQGMSPFDALGAYNLLQYTEHCEGILYPLGGFAQVPLALQRIAERNGANFRFNSAVKSVTVEAGQARGVELENGEKLKADVVLVNADLVWSMAHLYKETSYSKRLEEKPVSCSSISFYWSMKRYVLLRFGPTPLRIDPDTSSRNRKIPELNSHTIFLAEEYRE